MFVLDSFPLPNFLGFLALFSYVITLLPTILKIVFPKTKETGIPKWLLKHRRFIGVMAFFLALAHGYLLIEKDSLILIQKRSGFTYKAYLLSLFLQS